MLFAFLCTDKPDALQLRMDTRPEHVAYLDGLNAKGILKMAGPFLSPDGAPVGSLVIVEAADAEAARVLADGDPYAKAGLFAAVEIKPFNWVFNKPGA
ncbi:hypothetical protein BTR14_08590 [Rhizobium rhizosphaerae]|uniref:YCII-related domain-containing protein n=1 Tax=Xaviernesmea rhizosphaerae TaxID=1672749 RepID=A0ABX3PFX5_9HYPH|nr:YciI-like protein [Xaviernesmea rhizosphaerae]OQP86978.1 hypothetical protein BTR14_08590 [Xaviernesmea rhizosphaerae]